MRSAMNRRHHFSEMTLAEKAARLTEKLAKIRAMIEQQSQLMAELRRRMDPNEPQRSRIDFHIFNARLVSGFDVLPGLAGYSRAAATGFFLSANVLPGHVVYDESIVSTRANTPMHRPHIAEPLT